MKPINFLLIIICLTGCFGADPQKTGKEGNPLPKFSLLLTDSITQIRSQDMPSDKPIVFFFLSPVCPHCKAQIKMITDGMDILKDIQFYLITKYPISYLKAFTKEFELNKYPNIQAGIDKSHTLSDYFEVSGVPYLAIYGKNKKLNKTFLGKIKISQLKKTAEE